MSAHIRRIIGSKIFETINNNNLNQTAFQNKISGSLSLKCTAANQPVVQLRVGDLKYAIKTSIDISESICLPKTLEQILKINFDESTILATTHSNDQLTFSLNQENFLKETLTMSTPALADKLFDEPRENVVVEFSSPNIAKPFHLGHLRSTIIGNFLANVFDAYDHNVLRINYLGDWGTQFGYLKLGMDMANLSDDEIAKDPIRHLFNAYVMANRVSETDVTFAQQARDVFCQMENGALPDLKKWQRYREYTIAEMEVIYARLGVKFDVYSWESEYRKTQIQPHLDRMQKLGLLVVEPDGKQSFVLNQDEHKTLLKSDGTTLYLTRDVAAVIDRQQKYHFDRMYYVAGNDQAQHFSNLFKIASKLDVPNANRLHHVKFGRVKKMSTRKGNVVFLADILDEVRELMYQRQLDGINTKIDLANDLKTGDILSVSALISYELQRLSTSSYAFDMENIIKDANSSGKNYQITHCRLCSLESVTGIQAADQCDPKYFLEPQAIQLAVEIARFPEVLYEAKQLLGAQRLLNYIFALNTKTKKALKVLKIKTDSDVNRQAQRMLLFLMARKTLAKCMKIIGLTPLEKM